MNKIREHGPEIRAWARDTLWSLSIMAATLTLIALWLAIVAWATIILTHTG